jgi:hypothetical protein
MTTDTDVLISGAAWPGQRWRTGYADVHYVFGDSIRTLGPGGGLRRVWVTSRG